MLGKSLIAAAICTAFAVFSAPADWPAASNAGLAIGAQAPDFQQVDQSGSTRNLASLMGPKGVVLIFFRSADW